MQGSDSAVESTLTFANAQDVLERILSSHGDRQGKFLTMVQGNTYSDVKITDTNIKGNSDFILDIWD